MTKAARFILAAIVAASVWPAAAQPLQGRLGIVNTARILRDALPSQRAQKQIEAEFQKRDQEMARLAERLKRLRDDLDRNAVTMSNADKRSKEQEFGELNRDLQRRQREFGEDLAQRRNDAMAQIIERANRVIRQIAEQEKLDLIVQDAAFASPRLDITDRVIKALDEAEAR